MLVLSRERDQSLLIGNDIEVKIVDIRGDKVRLGIAAPKSVPIYRKEIQLRIAAAAKAEQAASTGGQP